jgi:hypothetical protein
MKNTNHRLFGFLFAVLAAAGLSLFGASQGWAQEKHRFSYKSPPGKYLQRLAIDIGDVPGHQVANYEVQYKFGSDAPVYDGVKVVESYVRGSSDTIAGSGSSVLYATNVMENGDKIFSQSNMLLNATVNPDGSRQARLITVGKITGGTGRFKGIRGAVHGTAVTDFKAGTSDQQNEVEYWFEK